MRISDWSSDVCSSDLPEFQFHDHSPLESHHFMLYLYNMSIHGQFDATFKALASPIRRQILDDLKDQPLTTGALCGHFADIDRCTVMQHLKIGRASCRERVCKYV